MGWRKITQGLPGQKSVEVNSVEYIFVSSVKIPGSSLDGYLYQNTNKQHIVVASNGMFMRYSCR